MKKILLTSLLIVSSYFFAYSQTQTQQNQNNLNVGGVNIGVGQVRVGNQQGGVIINGQTGQVTGGVRVGGVQIGGGGVIGGTGSGGGGGASTNGGNTGGTARAPAYVNQGGVLGLIGLAQVIVARSVPLLIGVALLAFFWFLIRFIVKGADSPDEQKKDKSGMFYSIIAIFVMVSIWGIIAFLGSTLNIQQGGSMPGFKLPGDN